MTSANTVGSAPPQGDPAVMSATLPGSTPDSHHQFPAQPLSPTTLSHTNTFAVIAIILAFVQPIAGIVFGHISLTQIKKHHDAGRGLALTALILSYLSCAVAVLIFVAYVGFFLFWGFAIAASPLDYSGSVYEW